jgi:hypothetical protein
LTVYKDGQPIGRIYEDGSASTPPELRWFWSITEIVRVPGVTTNGQARHSTKPRPSFATIGAGPKRADRLVAPRFRNALRTDLTQHNVEVKVQEDFKDLGGDAQPRADARGRDDGVRQEFGGGSKACQHLALLRK